MGNWVAIAIIGHGNFGLRFPTNGQLGGRLFHLLFGELICKHFLFADKKKTFYLFKYIFSFFVCLCRIMKIYLSYVKKKESMHKNFT